MLCIGKTNGCFSSDVTVHLADGQFKKISNLHVGDQVYVKSKNTTITSPVLAIFRHHRSSIRFINIYTSLSSVPLRLTPLHSVLVLPQHDTRERYFFAKDVSAGDLVFTSELQTLKVVDVKESFVYEESIYAAITFEGNIVANGIVASCYATYDHSTMHMMTTPIRWWYLFLLQLHQLIEFDYLQQLTSNIIVFFIDFYSKPLF